MAGRSRLDVENGVDGVGPGRIPSTGLAMTRVAPTRQNVPCRRRPGRYTPAVSTPARPDLKFDSLDAMLGDAERLKASGYEQAGQWTLGMILDHLAKTMSLPFQPGRSLPWPASALARAAVHAFAKRDVYPTMVRFPAMKSQRPTPDVDLATAYDAFRSSAERLKGLGDTLVCPPLGRLPTADFVAVQRLHGAHHLSFLRPTGG